ncbi:type II toxin-antitoxin system RelE/ParE family toxin [Flavobacterium limnophilum]|uniref:type II toxin-antitoxin system RelE/ParE family toxin n=1 Tax=Flavobacterium limnophilum TaxID=3003262 RepID=UPI0022AC5732|nr:type II toxin-antitoxin system RelE/ParE family toxin [Flavobacterium limnophilum]
MQKPIKILWDNQAKADLKLIFEFIKLKSLQGAKNVIRDIVAQSKDIHFVEQYQVDEFLGEPYRRMIVRNYKIVYKIHSKTEIRILQIFDTRQNPIKLKK